MPAFRATPKSYQLLFLFLGIPLTKIPQKFIHNSLSNYPANEQNNQPTNRSNNISYVGVITAT